MRIICILAIIAVNVGALEACCCSFWWTLWGGNEQCGCNIFGCNCYFADDDICYYGPLTDLLGYCYKSDMPKDGEIKACLPGKKTKVVCRSNEKCSAISAKHIVDPMSIYITLDINQDGFISMDEFGNSTSFLERFRDSRSLTKTDTTYLFQNLDVNNNGRIEASEIDISLKGITESPSNLDAIWKPNEEYIFKFVSQDLSEHSYFRSSAPQISVGIKLKANIIVQVLSDSTIRAKMDHIQFYTSAGSATTQTASMIFDSRETSFGELNNALDEFGNSLEQPIMITIKRGRFRKITVSKNEPEIVTMLKMSLAAELQDFKSSFRLKYLKKRAISSILRLPSQPKQLEV